MNCACGDEIVEDPAVTAPGGWCVPSETLYELEIEPMCSDCGSRLLFASEFGFDPGKNGENLRVTRGGIKYR
jgi:hypothetical protein